MHKTLIFSTLALATLAMTPATAYSGEPSRPAIEGCAWERLADAKIGLGAWVQRCDFGDRKIRLDFHNGNVAQFYSDGLEPEDVIDIFDIRNGETAEQAMRRVFEANTDAAIARRCVAAPYTISPAPAGVERYSFVPDAKYQAELDVGANPDEIPDAACGDFGDAPDSVVYFEIHPKSPARKILFVLAGQDEPLFDEKTLDLTAP